MDLQRLRELAGIGGNMNNPSQEVDSETPGAMEDPMGGPGSAGFSDVGDEGEGMEPSPMCMKIRDIAQRGLDEDPAAALQEIIDLVDSGGEGEPEEGPEAEMGPEEDMAY